MPSIPLNTRQRRAALMSGLDKMDGVKVLIHTLIWPSASTLEVMTALRSHCPLHEMVSIPYRNLILRIHDAYVAEKVAA